MNVKTRRRGGFEVRVQWICDVTYLFSNTMHIEVIK